MSGNDSIHEQSRTVDTGDQLSSVILLGMALAGGLLAALILTVIG
ncbi:hypothetical protein [Methylobacterium sp. JK268]